jgi:hypothetical protein
MHPSNKEQKKPKGFQPGSRRGQQKQLISDKIKQAREVGSAWLTHNSPRFGYIPEKGLYRLRIELPSEDNMPKYLIRGLTWAFLRCKRGVDLFEIHDYKGERLVAAVSGPYRTIQEDDILAIVVEKHRVDKPNES